MMLHLKSNKKCDILPLLPHIHFFLGGGGGGGGGSSSSSSSN